MGDKDSFCRREFSCSSFGLKHEEPRLFGEPQCGGPSIVYIIYRIILMCYCLAILIYSIIVYQHGTKWLIYLTYWAFTLLNIRLILQMIASVYHYNKSRKSGGETRYDSMPVLMKINWIFYNIAGAIGIAISLQYWTIVYKGWALNIVNVSTHAVNAAVIVLDCFISAIPVRLLHFYQSIIMALLYGIFNVVYWAAGGKGEDGRPWVYKVLDWGTNPTSSVGYLAVLVFAAPILGHLLLWVFYLLRILVYKVCCKREKATTAAREQTEMPTMP